MANRQTFKTKRIPKHKLLKCVSHMKAQLPSNTDPDRIIIV